jgi:hypothetical protein
MSWASLWYLTLPLLFVGRHLLLWLAYRDLAPRVRRRLEMPDGFRLRERFSPGWVYRLAVAAGLILAACVIAPTAHLALLLVDRGWNGRLAVLVAIFVAGAALLFVLDRWLGSLWRRRVRIPKDWRTRAA